MQFSRGCPFQCEFCDIIVTFGRRPRLKTSEQVLAELEALRKEGMRIVFIVDDNLIGNKKAIKVLLRDLVVYQQEHGYHFTFFTEASLDLADDPELMELMVEANFISVFIGIETPNEKSLRETKKLQNVRAGGTIIERVYKIQDAGMEVWCGMIIGFDHDDPTIFDAQTEFITEARIVNAMVGMLHAIPKTPLHARLAAEGRLDPRDQSEYGTNVIPLHLDRDELRDGYMKVMTELYQPEAYFGRLEAVYLKHEQKFARGRARWWRQHPLRMLKAQAANLARATVLFARLMRRIPEPELRREYRQRVWKLLKSRRDPSLLLLYVIKCAMHYHHHRMATQMTSGRTKVYNSF
jgi:radical SAM superfamily enzyme YgiQ (UPF0313 family)